MSRIVKLEGGRAQRGAASEAIADGLFCFQSINSTRFFTTCTMYIDKKLSDVIAVYGETRVFDKLPFEPVDEFGGDCYWSADYIVVLDKPDTELYNLGEWAPIRLAESGFTHNMMAIGAVLLAFFVTLGVGLTFRQGSLSVVYGVMVAAVVIAGFWYEYRAKAFAAGIMGWWYVHNAIRVGNGTREHYKELVTALAHCDDQNVADVNKQILRWL